jgi:hypothetical protein
MKFQIRNLILALAILGGATAALAQGPQGSEQSIVPRDVNHFSEGHFWLGATTLNQRSDFWDDNFQNFKASRGGFTGLSLGGDYIKHIDRHDAFMLSAAFSAGSIKEPSRTLVDESGEPLEHHLDLYNLSLTAAYLLYPAGTEYPVIPYLGGGVGVYAGQVSSYRNSFTTDDCDDDGNNCTVEYTDSETSAFLTVGYFALAGLEIPVSSHDALVADARYTVAHAQLGGYFKNHGDLDLSGAQFSAGMAIHF